MNHALTLVGWSTLVAVMLASVVWALCRTRWLRERPALRHVLWLLVLAKLVVPSFVSIGVLPTDTFPVADEVQLAASDVPVSTSPISEPTAPQVQRSNLVLSKPDSLVPTDDAMRVTAASPIPSAGSQAWFYVSLAFSFAVSCLLAGIAFRRCQRVHRMVSASAVQSSRATALLRDVADRFQVENPPAVWIVDAGIAPMLWGAPHHPAIVLPRTLFDALPDDQAKSVIAHELAHYVRRDHWANLFAFCVTMLAWWNPVAWLARRHLAEAAEASCDALVVERLPGFRKCYAETLLCVVDFLATVPPRPAALAINFGESRSLRRRFETLADLRVTSRVSRLGWLLLTLGAIVSMLVPVRAPQAAAEPAAPPKATADSAAEKAHDEQPGTDAKAPWPMQVVVVDEETGQPIADPRISLQLSSDTTSHDGDSRGEVLLTLPSRTPAYCYLRARAPGYAPVRAFWRNRTDEQSDEMPDSFTFRMRKAITVGGRVIDELGNPVSGATVFFSAGNGASLTGRRTESSFFGEEYATDVEGRWQCDLAPPDFKSGSIRVNHPDFARVTGHWSVQNKIEELRAGVYEFTLQRCFTVRGRVTDPDGKPVVGAVLAVGHANWYDGGGHFPQTDADGKYEFTRIGPSPGWPAGADPKLTMTAIKPGLAPTMQRVEASRTDPDPVAPFQDQQLDFQLKRGRTLRIRVVDAAGQGIAGATVLPNEWNETRPFIVLAKYGVPRKTNEDGLWEWTWAPPDDAIEYDAYCSGFMDVREKVIAATEDVNEVTITLKRPQIISGRVVDATTKQPIDSFLVQKGFEDFKDKPDGVYWDNAQDTRGRNGQYTKSISLPPQLGAYRYRVLAEGYQSQMSRSVKFEEGQVTLDFELTPLSADK